MLIVTHAVKGLPDIRDRGASTPAAAPPSDPNATPCDLAHATPNPILVDVSVEALMAAASYWGVDRTSRGRQDDCHAQRAGGVFPAIGQVDDPIRCPSRARSHSAGTGGGPRRPDPAPGGGQVGAPSEGRRRRPRPLAQFRGDPHGVRCLLYTSP